MSLLEVNNLTIIFGGLRAVDGFNLKIEKYEEDYHNNIGIADDFFGRVQET